MAADRSEADRRAGMEETGGARRSALGVRVLMLGWEFPPFMAGGLGTACFGLTRALNHAGARVLFVLPRAVGDANAEHVRLVGPDTLRPMILTSEPIHGTCDPFDPRFSVEAVAAAEAGEVASLGLDPAQTSLFPIASRLTDPYASAGGEIAVEAAKLIRLVRAIREGRPVDATPEELAAIRSSPGLARLEDVRVHELLLTLPAESADELALVLESIDRLASNRGEYGSDLFGDADRYARVVAALALRTEFDVCHAHDWLSFRAGIAVQAATGKPMIAHVHATEFDRSGDAINQAVYDAERQGTHAADRVIAVSQLTRNILVSRYGVDPGKIDVVYNGVELSKNQPAPGTEIKGEDKIVLFLGRITMQKGPEYFIRAAKRVLEVEPDVKFVVAGSGDMAVRMIEEAASLGIGHKVLFTGFLRGRDVERVFRMADCYVMPSVSEPFGIAALEAMSHDVPVIISKQSGVSEVLTHALKVDFWDVDDMANKIAAVLRHGPLGQTLRQHGAFEVDRLTWDDAARKVLRSYTRAGVPAGA